jgi:hypothetical protein
MTARPTFTIAEMKRAAQVARSEGVTITLEITPNQAKVCRIAPESATVPPASPLDEWRAKRAGNDERHS